MHKDHSDYGICLANLGAALSSKFEASGLMEDLDHAIEAATEAVEVMPQHLPGYASCLDSLANRLCRRFEQGYTIEDLNRAVKITDDAVHVVSGQPYARSTYLNNLAVRLGMRYKLARSVNDLKRRLEACIDGWECHPAPLSHWINMARHAADILASHQEWELASQILAEAVKLLPVVSPRYLPRADMQDLLAGLPDMTSTVASFAMEAQRDPGDALCTLELGHGIIAGLLMDMRRDLSDLKRLYLELAEKFILLRDELDAPVTSAASLSFMGDYNSASWEAEPKRRREATKEFDEVVEEISSQPEFNTFLQRPNISDLMAAAGSGPIVVINASSYRCDAFLIKSDNIATIELPLEQEHVKQWIPKLQPNSDLTPLLEWLWHAICRPNLDALILKDVVSEETDSWPHVWWVPTGLLSQLPLHAAGIYRSGSKETVLDRVISSYASSINALLHSRQHPPKTLKESENNVAVLVAMQNTPNAGDLPCANGEVSILSNLCPQLHLNVALSNRRKSEVLEHLKTCTVFYFADHGFSDLSDPSKSCLFLEDAMEDSLTVGDLRDSRLQENPPFLAYLSACSTGSNKVDNLSDKGIHLLALAN
jgi:tetratricopeptide (TPR) repeat protein